VERVFLNPHIDRKVHSPRIASYHQVVDGALETGALGVLSTAFLAMIGLLFKIWRSNESSNRAHAQEIQTLAAEHQAAIAKLEESRLLDRDQLFERLIRAHERYHESLSYTTESLQRVSEVIDQQRDVFERQSDAFRGLEHNLANFQGR